MNLSKIKWLFAVALIASLFVACDNNDNDGPGTVVDVLAGDNSFNTLVTAVGDAGLVSALQGNGPFTVFAPTDAAFAALPDALFYNS